MNGIINYTDPDKFTETGDQFDLLHCGKPYLKTDEITGDSYETVCTFVTQYKSCPRYVHANDYLDEEYSEDMSDEYYELSRSGDEY